MGNCKDCRWWNREGVVAHIPDDKQVSECVMLGPLYQHQHSSVFMRDAGTGPQRFLTKGDFGCVHHESKAE